MISVMLGPLPEREGVRKEECNRLKCPDPNPNLPQVKQRGTCIKGLFWPPLEPKTESCFSPISSYWFIRRIAQV